MMNERADTGRTHKRSAWRKPHRTPLTLYSGLVLVVLGLVLGLGGCTRKVLPSQVVVPEGEPQERAKAEEAGKVYELHVNKRPLPDLASAAPLLEVLEYAFNINGDVEAAYREWRAAIERVPQAGALPNARLEFGVLFSPGFLKAFKVMGTQDLPAAGKREARADQALADAQAAGERFVAAKYALQRRVTQAYAALALNDALVAQADETLKLYRRSMDIAAHRFHGMDDEKGSLADLRKVELEAKTVESERRSLEIMHKSLVAELNGILNRPPDAPLGKVELPAIGRPKETDADLFARAVEHNPELAALRKEIRARGAAQVLAELENKKDYSIGLGFEGLMPTITTGITLPSNRPRIRAGIAEALQMSQAAEARLRAAASDVKARVVMSLAGIRDSERVIEDYRKRIVPLAEKLLDTQLKTYESGGGDLLEVLDTQRLIIDLKKLVLRAEADRLRFLAELEEVMGEDIFQFIPGQKAEVRK